MPVLDIRQSLNNTYRQYKIDNADLICFKNNLKHLFAQIKGGETEEMLKGDIMDFLKMSFYASSYKVSPNGDIDCAIHLGDNTEYPVGVIFEVKTPNSSGMITIDNINKKALQELILYYLRERVEKKNIRLKHLIITNAFEYFIFDAHEFEKLFANDKKLRKEFNEFINGGMSGDTTDFFYKDVASRYIDAVKDKINYTHFDIRDYISHLEKDNDKKLTELYKIFSPTHLLKIPTQNDSNTLNKNFYSELLYIMGLEETGDKGKRIIARKTPNERNEASIIENTITVLDTEDRLRNLPNIASYGADRETQLFNVALELSINWVNRILFLKLLEAQLIKYHKGDKSYAFMSSENIADYDELNRLFFQVLARKTDARTETINRHYGKVPYLNSSLFEISSLENHTIRISNLDNFQLPVWSGTVLKDNNKPRYKNCRPSAIY